MADTSDNLDPKEATEAKLCAYLEGELSPAERIEIEQHLAANPQHRQLLVDLARTRDWMRSIPRETSPVDLGEVFQGQVERAMLLDDSADQSNGMSINRWPQYVLVAAITVLTLGLGVVLVAILKSPQQSGPGAGTYAIQNKSLSSIAPSTAPADETASRRTTEPEHGSAPPASAAPMAQPGAPSGAAVGVLKPAARLMGGRDREDVSQADALKARLATAGVRLPIDQKTVCFVVSADSPTTAVEQVRGFFDRHQIACDVTPTDKLENQTQGGNGGGGIAFGNSRNDGETRNAAVGEQNAARGAVVQNRQNAQQSPDIGNFTAPPLPNNPLNSPEEKSALAPPAGETYYIARGITPLQLELLNASLVSNDLKQKVERVTLVDSPASDAAKAPAPGAIFKGQTITVTIPQLVGPGIEKVNVVKVADDGTITLPMIDPLAVAGETVPELQQRVADKYREANLINDATVTAVVAAPPATQVVTAKAATTQATKDSKDSAATSKPVMAAMAPIATTRPAADLVDVVVVIQPSRFAAPAAPAAVPMK